MKNVRHKVLLIEDDKVDQMAFRRFVKENNIPYDYAIAGSVAESKTILASKSFDIVIADYFLGDGTALDILNLKIDAPVIVITGSGDEEIAVKTMKAGAYDYLIKDPANNYLKVLPATVENVIMRKRAEVALRESEERYRSLVESTEDSVYLADRDCRYLFVNEKYLSRFGLPKDKVVGRTYGEFHSEEDAKEFAERVEEVFETGKSALHEYRSRRDNRCFLQTLSPIKDSEGRVTAVTVVSKDFTERKQVEEQVEIALKEKVTLLKEIHHRVKNNFQVVSSLLNLQSESIEDKYALELFKISQTRINSMALIHEGLYHSEDLARIDFPEYIEKLVAELYSLYGVDFETIKLNINVEIILLGIDKAIPCGLIINELVSNSFKHAFPEGKEGTIQIAMHPLKRNEVELIIRDDGIGFPKDLDFRNTGTLGMQLIVTLTNQLDGTIELDRSGGTEFKITFTKL